MKSRSLPLVTRWIAGELRSFGPRAPGVTGASIDSRSLLPGDLFFALRGRNTDGRVFAREALERGASAVVLSEDLPLPGPRILVRDPVAALARLAAAVREDDERGLPTAAITGSVGKTTTCRYAAELLGSVAPAHRPPGSYNNALGVPLTILGAPAETRFLVLEVGSNAPGEILPLARAARPRTACVTAIAPVHLAGFGDMEGIAREKLSIFQALGPDGEAWIPTDLARAYGALLGRHPGRLRTFGPGGDLEIVAARFPGEYRLRFDGEPVAGEFRFVPPFPHSLSNLEAALAIVAGLGVAPASVLAAAASLTLPPLRGESHLHAGVEFLLDCYNSSPAALRSSIDKLAQDAVRGRRVCVLGTMEELGRDEQRWHSEIGEQIGSTPLDAVYVMGRGAPWFRAGLNGAGKDAELLADDDDSARRLAEFLRPGDRVLFKASRAERLERFAERVARVLEERGATC